MTTECSSSIPLPQFKEADTNMQQACPVYLSFIMVEDIPYWDVPEIRFFFLKMFLQGNGNKSIPWYEVRPHIHKFLQ